MRQKKKINIFYYLLVYIFLTFPVHCSLIRKTVPVGMFVYRYVNCTGTLLKKCTGMVIWKDKSFMSRYTFHKCTGLSILGNKICYNIGTLFTNRYIFCFSSNRYTFKKCTGMSGNCFLYRHTCEKCTGIVINFVSSTDKPVYFYTYRNSFLVGE
jgi:hypothetical protein